MADMAMARRDTGRSAAEERKLAERRRELRIADRAQLEGFRAFWLDRVLAGEDPLRERMTLFWHGHFPSSHREVQSSYELIRQNELLRANALGHFSDLLHGIARDPAMLEYLDNDSNRRQAPNENFARELMELFALGEGHYTERDVQEAARAFTGWTDLRGSFRVVWRRHDTGEKTILGRTGRFDGEDVVDILLEQDACAEHVAREIVAYLEGVAPDEERVASYAELLRESEYSIAALLERLFLDPAFYRDEVVGTRVASPIDYVVGVARRLDVRPPGRMVAHAAGLIGERLFEPPSVEGWQGGEAWITTSGIMTRSNLAGILLGVVDPRKGALRRRGSDDMEGAMEDAEPRMDDPVDDPMGELDSQQLRLMGRMGGPFLNLSHRVRAAGAATDVEVADALLDGLLAVEPSAEIRAEAVAFLAGEREALGLADGSFLDAGRRAEPTLRRAAHLILSLPDAHLH
jgi:uncharacterized protein (DUF1800 family)